MNWKLRSKKKGKTTKHWPSSWECYKFTKSWSRELDNIGTDENLSLGSVDTDDATTDSLVQWLLAMDLNGDGGASYEYGDGFFDGNNLAEVATESSIDCELNGCADIEWNVIDNDDCGMFLAAVKDINGNRNDFTNNNKCNLKNDPNRWFPPGPLDD